MTTQDASDAFADLFLLTEPEPALIYRSGLAVYHESFTRGVLVGRGWNAAGTGASTRSGWRSRSPA